MLHCILDATDSEKRFAAGQDTADADWRRGRTIEEMERTLAVPDQNPDWLAGYRAELDEIKAEL